MDPESITFEAFSGVQLQLSGAGGSAKQPTTALGADAAHGRLDSHQWAALKAKNARFRGPAVAGLVFCACAPHSWVTPAYHYKVPDSGALEAVFCHPEAGADDRGGGAPAAAPPATGVFLPPGLRPQLQQQQQAQQQQPAARCLALCGTVAAAGRPVLVVSTDEPSLRFFGLPGFEPRGRVVGTTRGAIVRALAATPGGFVAGDDRGGVKLWRWAGAAAAGAEPTAQ